MTSRSIAFIFIFITASSILCGDQKQKVKFGVIADCQYCSEPGKGLRKYSKSKQKLSSCVDHLNHRNLDFVIHLGDFIDKDIKSFDEVLPIYNRLIAPKYHALGNHDYDVKDAYKPQIPSLLGMPSRYYDFQHHHWRFIVLNGNEVSFHAYPKDSPEHLQSAKYYQNLKSKGKKWNGALGHQQMEWLKEKLTQCQQNKESVILFNHFPVYPKDVHNLWDSAEVIALIEKFSCVKGYFNGHNHKGNYGVKEGVHYLTFKGMVDTEETSFAVVTLSDNLCHIEGMGRENDRQLLFRE